MKLMFQHKFVFFSFGCIIFVQLLQAGLNHDFKVCWWLEKSYDTVLVISSKYYIILFL